MTKDQRPYYMKKESDILFGIERMLRYCNIIRHNMAKVGVDVTHYKDNIYTIRLNFIQDSRTKLRLWFRKVKSFYGLEDKIYRKPLNIIMMEDMGSHLVKRETYYKLLGVILVIEYE